LEERPSFLSVWTGKFLYYGVSLCLAYEEKTFTQIIMIKKQRKSSPKGKVQKKNRASQCWGILHGGCSI
jgi:hypothetical protein